MHDAEHRVVCAIALQAAVAQDLPPGLIDGALVWQAAIEPGQKDQWEPLTA